MTTGSTSNPSQQQLLAAPIAVPPALVRVTVELGLNQDRFKDSYVAWLTIYTSTRVDPNNALHLAAERAISQLMANAAQHLQLTP